MPIITELERLVHSMDAWKQLFHYHIARMDSTSSHTARNQHGQGGIDLEHTQSSNVQRHSLCFIHRLPNELLLDIFLSYLLSFPSSHAIIPISHVCGRWRSIAVGSPLLWSRLDLDRLHPAIIERSRSAPLRLHFQEILRGLPESVGAFVFANLRRVQELSVKGSETNVLMVLDAIHDLEAPLLQTAKISAWSEVTRANQSLSNLFNGKSPQLRCLIIEHMQIDWTWKVFPQLTKLRMRVPRKSYSGLFSILRRMPHLVALDLEESLPDDPTECANSTESLEEPELLNLQRLKLDDISLQNCTLFVQNLRISATTYIRLHIWVGALGQGVVQDGPTQNPPLCPPNETLDVRWADNDSLCFDLPFFQMKLEGGCTGVCFAAALPVIMHCDRLRNLRLDIRNDHFWSKTDWIGSLGQLTCLESLEFTMNQSGRTLVQALTAVEPANLVYSADRVTNVICPRLQQLFLTLTEKVSCLEIIRAVLSERAEMGARIPEVKIILDPHCDHLTPAEIEIMEGLLEGFSLEAEV